MNSIWEFFRNNTELISALVSLLILLVWIFYTQLLYRQFRHQHHPRLMIHQAPDTSTQSLCLLINMGGKLINVVSVLITAVINNQEICVEVSDYERLQQSDSESNKIQSDIRALLKQGPMASGDYIVVGKFDKLSELLKHKAQEMEIQDPEFDQIEIRIVIFHGKENTPIGAYRSFRIEYPNENRKKFIPTTLFTRQMITFWERRKVTNWIKCID